MTKMELSNVNYHKLLEEVVNLTKLGWNMLSNNFSNLEDKRPTVFTATLMK